jgi:predicted transcriptional regulator
MTEDISYILFDLFSPDRLTLISELSIRKQRLTALSKLLNQTVQECSRDLNRLSDSGFIRKDSGGLFEITPFGRAMLSLIPSLRFLVSQREYFLSHDLSFLPRGFIERIGELLTGERVNHISLVLEHIKAVVSKGEEYVWLISDQLFPRWPGIGTYFHSKETPVRLLCEQTIDRKIISEYKSALPRSEIAVLPQVKIAVAINETTAGVCFPNLDGKIDFGAGFAGNDPLFRGWCSDIFENYWSKSKKIQSAFQIGTTTAPKS